MRLQRYLALAGVASRRACEQLIAAGKVSVNGERIEVQGVRVDPDKDVVELDGERVTLPVSHAYLMLHKPVRVVTTMHDPQGRPTIKDYLPQSPRVAPVGRLDFFTSGLLLATNDGALAQHLTHPRHKVPKTYELHVRGEITRGLLEHLRSGVALDDGRTQPCEVRQSASDRLEIMLREGRNRQVRRMAAAVGLSVRALHRVEVAGIKLGDLPEGAVRALTQREIDRLRAMATG